MMNGHNLISKAQPVRRILLVALLSVVVSTLLAFTISVVSLAEPASDMKVDILLVVAHPDDHGGAASTLARYAIDQGIQVAEVDLTRGEGGGNAVGTETGRPLGILRETELRRAISILGYDKLFFLDLQDWAYTTSFGAALKFFGYDKPLGDLVRLVRELRPEVIITMDPRPTMWQHGHHQYAARLATEAFEAAADPNKYPEQILKEGLSAWQPKKLYYMTATEPTVTIPTTDISPKIGKSYAEIEIEALRNHKSQGFGSISLTESRKLPETFRLIKAVVPILEKEVDLLDGIKRPAGTAPLGLELYLETDKYEIGLGQSLIATLNFANYSGQSLNKVSMNIKTPEGWTVKPLMMHEFPAMIVGETSSPCFQVTAPKDLAPGTKVKLVGQVSFETSWGPTTIIASAEVRVTAPVSVSLKPSAGVRNFQQWCREQRIDFVVGSMPILIPLGIGSTGELGVVVSNHSDTPVEGDLFIDLPEGWKALPEKQRYNLDGNQSAELSFRVSVPAGIPVKEYPVSARTTFDGYTVESSGTITAVPTMTAAKVVRPLSIDGDLNDWSSSAMQHISHTNLWEGKTRDESDSSGDFAVAYDDDYLYVGVHVNDDIITTNIAPNDIRGHWRTDSVEICIDPEPKSEHTLTTFKLGIFPWDTEGNVRAARDADEKQGPVEETAPGTKLASKRVEDGYNLEVAIPLEHLKFVPGPGKVMGFNVLIYDADTKDAKIEDNAGKSRIAWSFWPGVQGRPEQWGEVHFE